MSGLNSENILNLSVPQLEEIITNQSQLYYTSGTQNTTDDEFDALVDRLRTLAPNSKVLTKVGWGYDVMIDSTPGEKYPHKYGQAGSLSKCYTWKEIDSQYKDCVIDVSAKIDGLSVVLSYVHGRLVQALTRGDGEIGIDVTDKIIAIIGHEIADKSFTGGVRGEIVMSHDNFIEFKNRRPDAKNPRNSAAGLINGKEITEDFDLLNVVVYSLVGQECLETSSSYLRKMSDIRRWLVSQFLCTAPATSISIKEEDYLSIFEALKDKWSIHYPIDGLVLSSEKVTTDAHTHAVRQISKAFKFKSEIAETEVIEVEWNLSKTRYLIPRIRIKPVQLAGTTVQYCTGYNAQYIKEHQVGPGCIVEVEKRGEIIPNVNKVILQGECYVPTVCPDCGTSLVWDGVHLACPNLECSNASVQDLLIWLSNIAPIEGFGDTLKLKFLQDALGQDTPLSIEKVMDGEVKKYINIGPDAPAQMQLFSKMVDDLYNRKIKLVDAILALNIPRLGSITALKLAMYPEFVQMLISGPKDMSMYGDLAAKVGVANAAAIQANSWKFRRLAYIQDRILFTTATPVENRGKVAVTGKLSVKRAQFESELNSAGYVLAEISKDTKFLITDDPKSASSKNKKADQWGIEKITESEFRSKYL